MKHGSDLKVKTKIVLILSGKSMRRAMRGVVTLSDTWSDIEPHFDDAGDQHWHGPKFLFILKNKTTHKATLAGALRAINLQ